MAEHTLSDRGAGAEATRGLRTLHWKVAGGAALAVIALLMLATVGDYGITWDEEFQSVYGDRVLDWFTSGFRDDAALHYRNLYLYGGFFDVLAELYARISPSDLYHDRHVVNVAFGVLTLAGTWRLGGLVLGDRGGVAAMVLTALTPMFYGHSFNNPKDVPFAALFVWTLCHLFQSARALPGISTSTVKLALCSGLLLAIRPGGIFFFIYIAAWWAVSLWRAGNATPRGLWRTAATLAFVLLGAWVIMLSFWPWAQESPVLNPLRGMKNAARFSFSGTTLFFGEQVPARPAPIAYLPTWFALQLPETYFVALAAGIAAYLARRRRLVPVDRGWIVVVRKWLASTQELNLALGFLAFVVVFPIGIAIILRSTLYDGVRHFLFLIPPLAVLAAAGLESGLRPPVPAPLSALLAGSMILVAALTASEMVSLHPYESIYFNRLLAGGVPGAAGRFETDYWGNSYREAAEWVVKNVPGQGIRIANCSHPLQSSYYLHGPSGARFIPVPMEAQPDLLLATTRWNCHRRTDARVLHTVQRQGVDLAYVLDLRR